MIVIELDVTKSTAEVDVVTDQSESVDHCICRPKSQSSGELPTFQELHADAMMF